MSAFEFASPRLGEIAREQNSNGIGEPMETEEKKVVLLVDDAPANIQVVNSILKDAYRIRVATNGAKALELAKGTPAPDLILLDIVMPEMDGYEVCSRLKAAPETRDIPVIFLTGKTETDDETKGFEFGAVDYIHKPFSPPIVKARVHTHLVLRGIREQLAQQLQAIRSELDTARQIQLSILPREIPKIAGLDIAARYVPMSSVAGDFYDFITVDEKRLGILVADVSGHGMPAALISSMLKIALAAQSAQAQDPAAVLTGLNQALCGKFQGHYVTGAYALVDMEKKTICYAGAGHPPLVLRDRSAENTREITQNGLFLGFFPKATYSAVEMRFSEGDWGVLYTDGVLEATDPSGQEFGADRLRLFLESNRNLGVDQFVDGLLGELSRWSDRASGREAEDDITVLAIHFKPLK
jgi:phosphoserine phosphatase RsbU/P